jgi:hypothetical protein
MAKKYIYVVQHDEDITRLWAYDDYELAVLKAEFIIEDEYGVSFWEESLTTLDMKHAEQEQKNYWFLDRKNYERWVCITTCEVNEEELAEEEVNQ